jgi:hypothetical protein
MTARDPHRDAGVPRPPATPEGQPKPGRDDAVAAGSAEELRSGRAGDNAARYASGRRDPEESGRGEPQKPHVTPNEKEGGDDGEGVSPAGGPAMPANASGEDEVPTEDQPTRIDDESAYDGRPEEDKRWSSEDA